MPSDPVVAITCAVEGLVDEHVLRRLVADLGGVTGPVHGKSGKPALLHDLAGYNYAARHAPWVVLVDLDQDADCAPPFVQQAFVDPSPLLCFRVAVRAVEAWLLADRERMATALGVRKDQLPTNPDDLDDPKKAVVELARRSRKKRIREELVPPPGNGRRQGPAYTAALIQFVTDREQGWRPQVAAERSDSLARTMRCIERLLQLGA